MNFDLSDDVRMFLRAAALQGCCAKNAVPASRCAVFGYCVVALLLLAGAVMGGAFLAASGTGVSESLGGLADTLVEQVSFHVTSQVTYGPDQKCKDVWTCCSC